LTEQQWWRKLFLTKRRENMICTTLFVFYLIEPNENEKEHVKDHQHSDTTRSEVCQWKYVEHIDETHEQEIIKSPLQIDKHRASDKINEKSER